MSSEDITVHIKYGPHEHTYKGPVKEVWRAVNRFFSELIPIFELARKAAFTTDLGELVDKLEGLISIHEDRLVIMADRRVLSDKDMIMLALTGAYVGYRLGSLPKETLSSAELRRLLEKSAKITSTRLSELRRDGWVEKTGTSEYRITPLGMMRFLEKRLPRIKARSAS
ncbi:hypothetical protein DRO32_04455 [Candidatus Bathyarchaeota archaeon]|nr:MAG: hypothetical protein DRO32_04455 [Candidatus Bathyarchaeota archaeon]